MLHGEDHDAYRSVHIDASIQVEAFVEYDFLHPFMTEWNHLRKTPTLATFRQDLKHSKLDSARKGVDFVRLQLIQLQSHFLISLVSFTLTLNVVSFLYRTCHSELET